MALASWMRISPTRRKHPGMVSPGVHQDFAPLLIFAPYVQNWSQGQHPRSSLAVGTWSPAGMTRVKRACDFHGLFLLKLHTSIMQTKLSRLRAASSDWTMSLCSLSQDSTDQTTWEDSPIADGSAQELEAKMLQLRCSLHPGCGCLSVGVICLRQPQ